MHPSHACTPPMHALWAVMHDLFMIPFIAFSAFLSSSTSIQMNSPSCTSSLYPYMVT